MLFCVHIFVLMILGVNSLMVETYFKISNLIQSNYDMGIGLRLYSEIYISTLVGCYHISVVFSVTSAWLIKLMLVVLLCFE